jgi:hypothetical protein
LFRYLKYVFFQIQEIIADLLIPLQAKLFSNSAMNSSKEQVLDLLKLMKPVASPKPMIRLGPAGDGGYLVPDDLDDIRACFSPGVSDEAGFELSFANRGVPCFLTDASVQEAPVKHNNISFEPLFLGPTSDSERFISLEDWVTKKQIGPGDLILQMDIEGAEYQVLTSTSQNLLKRFRIIAIELHHLEFILTNTVAALGFEAFIRNLREGFEVVHIHPNNNRRPVFHKGIEIPPVIEMTLIRKDRFSRYSSPEPVSIPHPLDSDNSPRRRHLTFSRDWIS